jgi:phage-related tail fiber protein
VTGYVADELAKLDTKQSVRVATTSNIALKASQTIDGVAVVAGDRVLVKNQTSAKDNGLYVVANEFWVRTKDSDSNLKVTAGLTVSVEQGTTQADTIWQLITDAPVLLGTTALVFQNITFGFAPLSSPIFSGSPTAPTANVFSNDDALATTKFVQRALGNYAGQTNYDSSTQLTVADVGKLSIFTTAGSTATLPDWNSVPPGGLVHLTSTGGLTVKTRAGETFGAVNTTNLTSVVLQPGNFAVFRRLLLGPGWSLDSGDAALKYSPMFSTNGAVTGYMKHPGGAIEQWGQGTTDASGNVYITYPLAFPSGMRAINCTHSGSLALMSCIVFGSDEKTRCTLRIQNGSNTTMPGWVIYWRAIGI